MKTSQLLLLIIPLLVLGCAAEKTPDPFYQDAIRIPKAGDFPGDDWIGYAIDYSGFREGQDPNGEMPTKAQIREDLHILDPHFSYIRVYASNRPDTRTVLEVIKEDKLNIKVVLGAWLQCEKEGHYAYMPEHFAINETEIATAISLAKEFPDTIVAVTVGNEILVDWSFWPVPLERVISLVKQVQSATGLPVSVADDYSAWAAPDGIKLAEVTDFVFLHTHPIWHKQDIDTGFQDFLETFQEVRSAVGPDKRLIVGETGWATRTTPPDKEPLHVPNAGSEEKQAVFWHQLHDWAIQQGIPIFWFSAFDEPWKDSEGTEGFWGIYHVDRSPKLLLSPAGHRQ